MVRGDVAHRLCLVSLLNNRFVAAATVTPCQIDEWSFHFIMETCSLKKGRGGNRHSHHNNLYCCRGVVLGRARSFLCSDAMTTERKSGCPLKCETNARLSSACEPEKRRGTGSDRVWIALPICIIGWNELWSPPADCVIQGPPAWKLFSITVGR